MIITMLTQAQQISQAMAEAEQDLHRKIDAKTPLAVVGDASIVAGMSSKR